MTGRPGTSDGRRRVRARLRAVRPLVMPLVVATVATGVLSFAGLALTDAALLAATLALLVLLSLTLDAGHEHRWPDAADVEAHGSRRDVTALIWTFVGRDGRVSEMAVRRLREDARRRLQDHGVALPAGLGHVGTGENAPEAEAHARALLGDDVWRALTTRGGWLPTLPEVEHVVTVLEHLGTTAPSRPLRPTASTTPDGRTSS